MYRWITVLLVAFLFMITGSSTFAQSEPSNLVQGGFIDLSYRDETIDFLSLAGEWEFYKNQLLTPDRIDILGSEPNYIRVTAPWDKLQNEELVRNSIKYGTYRLKMKLALTEVGQHKALYISDIASAYNVWLNGTLLGGIGIVGKSASDEVPKSRAKLIFFKLDHVDVDIIIQVSNFTSRNEGTFKAIQYGNADTLVDRMMRDQLLAMLTIGGLLIIGLYHLIIFGIRGRNSSTLYIGLLAVDIGIRGWIKSTYLVDLIIPSMSWELIVKLDYITGYLAYLFIVMLMNAMYPLEKNRHIVALSHLFTTLFCVYIIVTPATLYTQTLTIQFAIMLLFSLNTIGYVCIVAIKRRREGAILNVIGYMIIVGACINDVMLYQRMIDTTEVLYEAIFLFVLLQATIISYRYSQLFQHNVVLSADLLQLNRTLEQRVEERTADLNSKNDELHQMNHSRTEMMANISHDMGSPITGIQMNMQLMKDGMITQEQQQVFIQSMLDKAGHIKLLNDELFQLSMLESGQYSFHFKKMVIGSYLENLIRSLIIDFASEDIELEVGNMHTMLIEQELWVYIDPMRIKQVIYNYVGNAIRFSNGHSIVISLDCQIAYDCVDVETPHAVVFEVLDRGTGIEQKDLPFVFDRFYRRSEGYRVGSGLGLAIAKEIIEHHQGQVGVISTLDEGTTFSFILPAYITE